MGFRLSENFNKPYLARSISDFWRRWHISLSSWFRDYVYVPLGGNRTNLSRTYANIFIVFLLSGFWHGANWTFLLWGGLHGVYVICSRATTGLREGVVQLIRLNSFPNLRKYLQVAVTFSLVSFAWIFFRAKDVDDALYIASHLFAGGWYSFYEFFMDNYLDSLAMWMLHGMNSIVLLLAILIGPYAWRALRKTKQHERLHHFFLHASWPSVRWVAYVVLFWGIVFLGTSKGELHQFIYFAF
jgi:D-alanyl-lipoteichoic acid acyltransferase DltB (MBOAT superfamily)